MKEFPLFLSHLKTIVIVIDRNSFFKSEIMIDDFFILFRNRTVELCGTALCVAPVKQDMGTRQ